jgi:hypothetical protein
LSEVLTEDLSPKSSFVLSSPFFDECGLKVGHVLAVVYNYLSKIPNGRIDLILNKAYINLNLLAWYIHHRVPLQMHRFSMYGDNKLIEERRCVICHAKENVTVDEFGFKFTVSPLSMTRGREPQRRDDGSGDFHIVIWTRDHEHGNMMSNLSILLILKDLVEGITDVKREVYYNTILRSTYNNVYVHRNMTYGHGHCHLIGGDYFKIRAREMFLDACHAIRVESELDSSDIFNPIRKFWKMCCYDGKRYVYCMIMLHLTRINLPNDCCFYNYFRLTFVDVSDKVIAWLNKGKDFAFSSKSKFVTEAMQVDALLY